MSYSPSTYEYDCMQSYLQIYIIRKVKEERSYALLFYFVNSDSSIHSVSFSRSVLNPSLDGFGIRIRPCFLFAAFNDKLIFLCSSSIESTFTSTVSPTFKSHEYPLHIHL